MTSANVPGRFIPHSDALREAGDGTSSIPELLSRDVERLTRDDRRKLITEMQLQRLNWQQAEASGATRAASKANSTAVKSTTAKSEDLF